VERRALPPDKLPLEAPEGSLFTGVRRTLQRVLSRSSRSPRRIARVWQRLLRRLGPSRDDYDRLAALNLAASYRLLLGGRAGTASGDEAYGIAVDRDARALMRSGVPEDHAIAAVALYLEACLAYADGPAEARALIRLTSATQRLVAAGYAEERAAGQRRLDDRERQKLSGDLHDEVGGDLVVLKLYVEMIALELAKGSVAHVAPKLQEALVLIAHSIESVRRLTLDLGPAFLDSLGFLPALRSVVRQFALRTGIKAELEATNASVSLPAHYESALYRVLLGALSNVAKHSQARHVTVTVRGVGDVFMMIVEDDGKGFDMGAQDPDRGVGFTAMRERVRGLRGHLSIESRTAGRRGERSGTRIEVRLPLRKRVAA
jgi:signal transduction histidine kinase